MNILTELWVGMPLGSYTGTRGWDEKTIAGMASKLRQSGFLNGDKLSDEGLALRERIEDVTDNAQADLVTRLGDDVQALLADLNQWSELCIAAAAFPPDAYKRAAG